MATFHGTSGNDDLTGTSLADDFGLGKGGSDKATGGGGWDVFHMGAALDASDQLKGGAGRDTVMLKGDYSTALFLGANTFQNIERVYLNAGFSYYLVTDEATVAAGEQFRVNGSALGSGDVLTFDGLVETDGSFNMLGGAGDDGLTGGAMDDRLVGNGGTDALNISAGGADIAYGGAGANSIYGGAAFGTGDHVNGGKGADTLALSGDYTGVNALVITASMLISVDRLFLFNGSSYDITVDDGVVRVGDFLNVDGAFLDNSRALDFDGSAETDGSFTIQGGAGSDSITGGAMADLIYGGSNDDSIDSRAGNDSIGMGAGLTASDTIDGGLDSDDVDLEGDYTGGNAVVFTDTTMVAVETLRLHDGFSYDLTFADGTVNSFTNLTLTVNATTLTSTYSAIIDGSAEADSNYVMNGGAGGDDFIGGAFADELNGNDGNDTLTGGGGLDNLTGGAGADTFRYTAVSQSTSTSHDHVNDFDAASDFFDTTVPVSSIGTAPIGPKTVNNATFDADMGTAISDSLPASGAVVINVTAGDYAGHAFLVIDANANGSYNGGVDYMIDITGFTGTITTGNFI